MGELTDNPDYLASAAGAVKAAEPPIERPFPSRRPADVNRWYELRADAVAALARNPHTPAVCLTDAVAVLDERAVTAILNQSPPADLDALCRRRIQELDEIAARNRPPQPVEVPPDDDLAKLTDPAAELTTHLRHLRSRAAQRDVTIAGLLQSRYASPEILRALPAYRILDSADKAALVATMIADSCGDDPARWQTLATLCQTTPDKKTTFGRWLDSLSDAAPVK